MALNLTKEQLAADAKKQEEYEAILKQFEEEENFNGDFDPFEIAMDSKIIKTIRDQKLGKIKFTELTFKDQIEIQKLPVEERAVRELFLYMHNAYPNLTEETIKAWPFQKRARMNQLFAARVTRFLQDVI
jgi:N6-adenosine-specific RNA methylase IME4